MLLSALWLQYSLMGLHIADEDDEIVLMWLHEARRCAACLREHAWLLCSHDAAGAGVINQLSTDFIYRRELSAALTQMGWFIKVLTLIQNIGFFSIVFVGAGLMQASICCLLFVVLAAWNFARTLQKFVRSANCQLTHIRACFLAHSCTHVKPTFAPSQALPAF